MKKYVIILCLILLSISTIQAQEEKEITLSMPRFRLGIEAGMDVLSGKINKPEQIRESQSYYSDGDNDYYGGFVSLNRDFAVPYLGLKMEYALHKRISVSAGLRFSFYKMTMKADRDYFLWRVYETQTSANYVKINHIGQQNYYAGVPLEIRFFPNEKDYFARVYILVGTSLNFLAASKNNVEFRTTAMEKYASEIMSHIEKPSIFQGNFYGGVGLKLGKMDKPFVNIEAHFPTLSYGIDNPKSFTNLTSNPMGGGIRVILYMPFLKEQQLIYKVTD